MAETSELHHVLGHDPVWRVAYFRPARTHAQPFSALEARRLVLVIGGGQIKLQGTIVLLNKALMFGILHGHIRNTGDVVARCGDLGADGGGGSGGASACDRLPDARPGHTYTTLGTDDRIRSARLTPGGAEALGSGAWPSRMTMRLLAFQL